MANKTHFIASAGLSGGYMPNTCAVFDSLEDAVDHLLFLHEIEPGILGTSDGDEIRTYRDYRRELADGFLDLEAVEREVNLYRLLDDAKERGFVDETEREDMIRNADSLIEEMEYPFEAGNEIAEIAECDCDSPWQHDEGLTERDWRMEHPEVEDHSPIEDAWEAMELAYFTADLQIEE